MSQYSDVLIVISHTFLYIFKIFDRNDPFIGNSQFYSLFRQTYLAETPVLLKSFLQIKMNQMIRK